MKLWIIFHSCLGMIPQEGFAARDQACEPAGLKTQESTKIFVGWPVTTERKQYGSRTRGYRRFGK